MLRRVLAVLGATMIVMVGSAPVLADPPSESGVVVRFSDSGSSGVLTDDESGHWVFVNVTRADFCVWLGEGQVGQWPVQTSGDVQLVTGKKTQPHVKVRTEAAPTALHAIRGAGFDAGPCDGSEVDPSYLGELDVQTNVNGNTGLFSERGVGTVYEVATGAPFFYSYKVNIFLESGKVVAQQYNLHPVGK